MKVRTLVLAVAMLALLPATAKADEGIGKEERSVPKAEANREQVRQDSRYGKDCRIMAGKVPEKIRKL